MRLLVIIALLSTLAFAQTAQEMAKLEQERLQIEKKEELLEQKMQRQKEIELKVAQQAEVAKASKKTLSSKTVDAAK
jgi:sensor domain CHASE-containing protein